MDKLRRSCLAILLAVSLAPAVLAQNIPLTQWGLNAWGTRPTKVEAQADVGRCGTGGFYFAKQQQGDGEAELVLPGTLVPGQAYLFTVQLKKVSGQGWVDLFFRRAAAYYETTSIRTIQPGPLLEEVALRGIYDASTSGGVRVALRGEGLGICLFGPRLQVIAPESVGAAPNWHSVSPRFFGIHLNKLGSHNGWPKFNPGIVRMWDTGTTWADLQPDRGPIDWRGNAHGQRFDYFTEHVRNANPQASLLVTLGMTPEWAANSASGSCSEGYYGKKACLPPTNLEDWRRYVRELAVRFKGRARYWEILNEADIPMLWKGDTNQLISLVRAAREELKAVDPGNVVLSPNVTVTGYRLLSDFLRLGGADYVDAISVHAYIGRSPGHAITKLRNLQQLLIDQNVNLPIWNTESGLSCTADVDCVPILAGRSPIDGVSALAQAYLGQAALGIANVSYFTFEGGVTNAGGLSLVQSDYLTPTRAGEVLAHVADWLRGSKVKWEVAPMPRVKRLSLRRESESCTVLWSEGAPISMSITNLPGVSRLENALGSLVLPDAQGVIKFDSLPVKGCVPATGQ